MEENKIEKNNNKTSTIIIVVLLILLMGISGYVVYDKTLSNKKENNNVEKIDDVNNVESNVEKSISIDEADKIIMRIFNNYFFSPITDEIFFKNDNIVLSDELKLMIVVEKVSSYTKDYSCKQLFGDDAIASTQHPKGTYIIDGVGGICTDSTNETVPQRLFNYDDLNNLYKKIFGNQYNAPKKSFYNYAYSELKNVYVYLSPEMGDCESPIIYSITNAFIQNNKVYINMNYSSTDMCNGDYSDIKLNDGTSVRLKNENDADGKDYFEFSDGTKVYSYKNITDSRLSGKMLNNVKFSFIKEDGVYKLSSIEKK